MKLFLTKPSDVLLLELIHKFDEDEFTYQNVGSTKSWATSIFAKLPNSKVVDNDLMQYRRVTIGNGQPDFDVAASAVQRGVCFDLPWLECHHDGEFDVGDTFSLSARAFGIWTANFCKVVYIEEREFDSGKMFSLGLGTLSCHAAKGEERFSILWNYKSNTVDLLIGSFSRPHTVLTKLFVKHLRKEQNRFATESAQRVREYVDSERPSEVFASKDNGQ